MTGSDLSFSGNSEVTTEGHPELDMVQAEQQ